MDSDLLPEDTSKQWQVLLCIIAFEERKLDNRHDKPLDTLTYFYHHKGVRHIFTEWMQQMQDRYDQNTMERCAKKSDVISLSSRQEGNARFKVENYEESFKFYSKSVMCANKHGPMYSIALANRSAASLRLKKYKESLKDVERALSYNYPENLLPKLFLRRAECYYQMGYKKKSVDALDWAVEYDSSLENTAVAKGLREKLAEMKENTMPVEYPMPQLHKGENPDFRSASAAVELRQNEILGRYVVTKEDTKRGDVLFSEAPYTSVKLRDSDGYCDFCCDSEAVPVPCDNCSVTEFCDEACYYLCQQMYHRWECAGMRSKIFSVIGIAHLAFRVMLKYVFKGFPKLPESAGTPTTAFELLECYIKFADTLDVYKTDTDPFYSMFKLKSNMELSTNSDNIQYALTATMLVMYLEQEPNFFEYFSEQVGYPLSMSEMKLFCATLMYRTLGQLIMNSHTILDLNTGPPLPNAPASDRSQPWRHIGSAIYPSISMLNHSCEPNIINVFYKNYLYVKGIKELAAGTEVLNCYGPHYARHERKDRLDKLREHYGFTCQCPACTDETRKDFVMLFTAFSCPSCKGPVTWNGKRKSCHQCPHDFPLQRAENAVEAAAQMHEIAMHARTAEERCEQMVRAYRLMQKVLYRHHDELRKIADDLAKLYAAIGEYAKSIDLIKQNIQSFEYQFGSFSVEVTNEIRKMANMMLGRIIKYFDGPEQDERPQMNIKDWIRETLKIVKKANQLMELNYGTWRPMYRTLKEKEDILDGMLSAPRVHDDPECIHYKLQSLNVI